MYMYMYWYWYWYWYRYWHSYWYRVNCLVLHPLGIFLLIIDLRSPFVCKTLI